MTTKLYRNPRGPVTRCDRVAGQHIFVWCGVTSAPVGPPPEQWPPVTCACGEYEYHGDIAHWTPGQKP